MDSTATTHRLPTLYEVLNRQAPAPVDLWSFYTFLSQYPYAINFLDFWIDLMAHLRLCKDYVKGIRESVLLWEESRRNSRNSDEARNSLGSASVSSSMLLEALMNDGYLDYEDSKRVSQFLRGDTRSPGLAQLLDNWKKQGAINDSEPLTSLVDEFLKTQANASGKSHITTKQLLNNANSIVTTYLLSPEQSSRYLINIPDHMRAEALHMVRTQQRHDPDVFEHLKSLAFQFLEMDCFPKFLSCVALHNLHDDLTTSISLEKYGDKKIPFKRRRSPFTNYTTLTRVVVGMLLLGIGFWIGYVLIFLNYPRGIRVTTIVPFFLGCYYLCCGVYRIDVVYAFFGVTQALVSSKHNPSKDVELGLDRNMANTKYGRNVPVIFNLLGGTSRLFRVRHPFVDKMLKRRALWCLTLILAGTGVLTIIFSCVPGRRL